MASKATKLDKGKGWGGVFALSLTAFALVASEFMPVSLLTPIAATLKVSEGAAGQAIAVSGAFALLTSLSITTIAKRLDRKVLLLSLTLLMLVSGLVVSFAPNYQVFMLGRALIGIAIGGFWSMSAATAMRLVSEDEVSRAFAILNGGNALATVVAAPIGSFLGSIIGWRGAFFCVVPVAALTFGWQWISLPSMKVRADSVPGNIFLLMKRQAVAWGMVAISVLFMGQFMLFTYLRPFLEAVTRVSISQLSIVLLAMGTAGFAGTVLIGKVLEYGLYRTLIAVPLMMAVIALALTRVGGSFPLTFVLLTLWGLIATAAPVAWWMWLANTLPNEAETGGGLLVAIVQLAISLGATLGGFAFDAHGYRLTFEISSAILIVAACLTLQAARARSTLSQTDTADLKRTPLAMH